MVLGPLGVPEILSGVRELKIIFIIMLNAICFFFYSDEHTVKFSIDYRTNDISTH